MVKTWKCVCACSSSNILYAFICQLILLPIAKYLLTLFPPNLYFGPFRGKVLEPEKLTFMKSKSVFAKVESCNRYFLTGRRLPGACLYCKYTWNYLETTLVTRKIFRMTYLNYKIECFYFFLLATIIKTKSKTPYR